MHEEQISIIKFVTGNNRQQEEILAECYHQDIS